MLTKIVSGCQTGVDRGALDAALDVSFPCGGWCPEDRRAEDGPIPEKYPVKALPGAGYRQRTKGNVMDSDGTLVIYFAELVGGTRETVRFCERYGKPALLLNGSVTSPEAAAEAAVEFITRNAVRVLNVAGPRESTYTGAAEYAREVVSAVLAQIREM